MAQHHSIQKTMPQFKSKLFQRNQGGHGKMGGGLYAPRRQAGFYPPNPRPLSGTRRVNARENKQRTFNLQSSPAGAQSQANHLDIIPQGAGASARIGQKFQVTAIHIRGEMRLSAESGIRDDTGGYYLLWDKQPNKALANPLDILDLQLNTVTNADAFPLASNSDRFVILARKSYDFVKQETATGSFDSRHIVDDYFQFRRTLIATCQNGAEAGITPTGIISTRTSGALLMLPFGNNLTALSFNYSYRVYFNDV